MMTLYNKFIEGYDNEYNGGKEDHYHGEHDEEPYGKLYIPYIEEAHATSKGVEQVFNTNQLGKVTYVTFKELAKPTNYKGKSQKTIYSAMVYLKWNETNPEVSIFRENVANGNKDLSKVYLDKNKKTFWIVRPNTVISDELFEERYVLAVTKETAEDAAMRVLEDDGYKYGTDCGGD